MIAFQGGHPPFKGDSPYLRPQPSHVMQAGPEQKKPNRRARCMQPPSGYKWPSTFAQTSRRKGG
jgi:hypothetical protein